MSANAAHDEPSSFIKTPQQLVVVIALAFLVPIISIILLVKLVSGTPTADPAALAPDAVAARIQPVGRVEIGAPAAAPGARSGEEIVKAVCSACHQTGVANAPKIGDEARWAQLAKTGMKSMLASAVNGKGAMPPRGGSDATDEELARAIVVMANQSGQKLKAPAGAPPAAAKSK